MKTAILRVLYMSCVASVASAGESTLSGAWGTEVTALSPQSQVLVFENSASTWTGSMTSRFGTMKVKQIVVEGAQVSFSEEFGIGFGPVGTVRVQGTLRGKELLLKIPSPTGTFITRVAHRLDTQEARAVRASTPASVPLTALPDNGLARVPPMGWNSWNHYGEDISDKTVREVADALVETGLRDSGYVYVNLDDGWQGVRDANGVIHANAKFPDMKSLADYLHGKGLKFGLYSSPGTRTCARYEGSYGHEDQDAKTFAEWGVDYLKYDWCNAAYIYSTPGEMQAAYLKMGAALQASGRPIVYSLCQYGLFDVGTWGRKVGGNLWRTTYDILDYPAKMEEIGFSQNGREADAGPGGWNDPDMLEIGNGGMTLDEYRTHMTLWAILSAPLLLGNDVRIMTPDIKKILTNPEVIAIDQDALGIQARRLRLPGKAETWVKPLADGSVAVALFNREDSPGEARLDWSDVGLFDVATVRDLWQRTDLAAKPEGYRTKLPPHGSAFLRLVPKRR